MSHFHVNGVLVSRRHEAQNIDYHYYNNVGGSKQYPHTRMSDLGELFNDAYYGLRRITMSMIKYYAQPKLDNLFIQPLPQAERNLGGPAIDEIVGLRFEADVIPEDVNMQEVVEVKCMVFDNRHFSGLGSCWTIHGLMSAMAVGGVMQLSAGEMDQLVFDEEGAAYHTLYAYAMSTFSKNNEYFADLTLDRVEAMMRLLKLISEHFTEGFAHPGNIVGIRRIFTMHRVSYVMSY